MNKSVKVILAIAIGIIYPILVLFIALVFYPSKNYEGLKKTPPELPVYSQCVNPSISKPNVADKGCQSKLNDAYNKKVGEYNQSVKDFNEAKSKATTSRVQVALIAAIIGFILATVAYRFTPITVGMSGGSTVLVLFSSYYAKTMSSLVTILFAICFVSLVAMLFFVDRVLPKPVIEDFTQEKK